MQLPSLASPGLATDTMGMDNQVDFVMRSVEERRVRLVRLWFTDVLGQLKSFAISPAELENALSDGMTFDGSSIDGFSRVFESDVLAKPDASTFELLPWTAGSAPEARIFCDVEQLDGTPFAGDPRQVLKRNMARAQKLGYTFYVAPEMEYFYFDPKDASPIPLDQGSYFDLTTADVAGTLRKRTIQTIEAMGIPVEYSFHEDSPSQHEIDLRYTDALTMADSVMTFRLVVREVAATDGLYATFMPKPLEGVQGSGMHTHLSLYKGEVNAFHDPDDKLGLSKVGKAFIAGLLRHAPEITAITNQTVNSYKRLIPGFEARNNRSALIRVPTTKGTGTRVEYRSPDPVCNPYLAFSVMLAAGLKGIEEGYELPAEATGDVGGMTEDERAAIGMASLPQSLSEALKLMENSDLVREALGEHIFEWFLRNKRKEWQDYKGKVTQFELDRYLRMV
jgi:glutamine synthetase